MADSHEPLLTQMAVADCCGAAYLKISYLCGNNCHPQSMYQPYLFKMSLKVTHIHFDTN